MEKKSTVLDLIYLDETVNETLLVRDYQTRIDLWNRWLENRKNDSLLNIDEYVREQAEYYHISGFLDNFLSKRLAWIVESVSDPALRLKYLLALPPFSQKGNLKQFLLHFFQLGDHKHQDGVVFLLMGKAEREIRIRWDMYKLLKTRQTIQTISRWISAGKMTPDAFSTDHATKVLTHLSKGLHLLFKMCVRDDAQKSLETDFPKDLFQPESVLAVKESNEYLINESSLNKLDYRNYLFFIYYKPEMKVTFEGESVHLKMNYLDYEIIRQEFLINWLNQRLSNNRVKQHVFRRYRMGQHSFADLVERHPTREIELLKKLPKSVFNDIVAQVDTGVEEHLKSPVDPMSETYGEFAAQRSNFDKAIHLVKTSVQAIKDSIVQSRRPKLKLIEPLQMAIPDDPPPDNDRLLPDQFSSVTLGVDDIDFPFFSENNAHFSRLHQLLKNKLEPRRYEKLNKKVEKMLTNWNPSKIIKRRNPRHEWAIPFFIEEYTDGGIASQLLILGAELKNKPASMAYSEQTEQRYDFRSYFVYGTKEKKGDLGFISEDRSVNGEPYYVYDFSHPSVIRQALILLDSLLIE